MGKAKGGKKKLGGGQAGVAAKLEMKAKRKVASAAKANPFERRYGREKHKVINRKSKTDAAVGRPGISRQLAVDKRKATLLKEYVGRHKSNTLLDKRIGEADPGMTAEQKAEARFAMAEKSRRAGKKSLFVLGDEEETLTHAGRDIADIERFEDPRSDEEEEEVKKLDANFVSETHFGGFMSKSDLEYADGRANTRKEWIDKMIQESKARKAEKQKDVEEAANLTKDLDSKWRDMFGDLKMSGEVYAKGEKVKEALETAVDNYDTLLRELTFEKGRKVATERLKTEEEVIKEEKEKLERMEEQRLKRMQGEDDDDEDSTNDEQEESDAEKESDEDDENEDEEEEEREDEEDEDEGSDLEHSDEEDIEAKKKVAKERPPKVQNLASDIPFTFKGKA